MNSGWAHHSEWKSGTWLSSSCTTPKATIQPPMPCGGRRLAGGGRYGPAGKGWTAAPRCCTPSSQYQHGVVPAAQAPQKRGPLRRQRCSLEHAQRWPAPEGQLLALVPTSWQSLPLHSSEEMPFRLCPAVTE